MAEKPMSNFKTAVNELMNGKIKTDESGPIQSSSERQTYEPVEYRDSQPFNAATTTTPSVFAADLIIEGTVKSKSDIKLNGYIKGDVSSGGSIVSTGTIDGNIDCTNVVLSGSTINGNINAKDNVTLDSASSVTGDIIASTLNSDGRVKGNIILKEGIALKSNASVLGNIKAKSIAIESGTTLVGNLEIKSAQSSDISPPSYTTPAPTPTPDPKPAPVVETQSEATESSSSSQAASSVADLIAKKEALKDSIGKKD